MTHSQAPAGRTRLHPALVVIVMLAVVNALLVVGSLVVTVAFAGPDAAPGLLLSALFATVPFAVVMVMCRVRNQDDAVPHRNT